MTPFRTAHSGAADWRQAANACADSLGESAAGASLGFLYLTDHLAEHMGEVLEVMRQRTGIQEWVGTVGMGICADDREYFNQPAVAAMTAALPADSFRILPPLRDDLGGMSDGDAEWIDRQSPAFGVVHGDPTHALTPALIEALSDEGTRFLVGGLTASRRGNPQVAGRLEDSCVSGVLFAPSVEVATGLTQGCTPLGPVHTITECSENVLMTLDGQPALDVFKDDIGELLSRDLNRVGGYIHAALPIAGSDTGDYTVRNLVAIDPAKGWLAIGEQVSEGDRVMFVRRDPQSAEEDLRHMLERLRNRLGGTPRGALYFSCVGRGASMFGAEGREVAVIREVLGAVPLVGFFGNGEISRDRIYRYTGVLTLFT
jgi:small ligand-binding sensory domain FIST